MFRYRSQTLSIPAAATANYKFVCNEKLTHEHKPHGSNVHQFRCYQFTRNKYVFLRLILVAWRRACFQFVARNWINDIFCITSCTAVRWTSSASPFIIRWTPFSNVSHRDSRRYQMLSKWVTRRNMIEWVDATRASDTHIAHTHTLTNFGERNLN